jgi:hypothetical protein
MHCRFILIPYVLMVFMVWGVGGWIIESIIVTGTPWTVSYNSAMVLSDLCMVLLCLFIYVGFMRVLLLYFCLFKAVRRVREENKVQSTHIIR